jgi:hypothetical protein
MSAFSKKQSRIHQVESVAVFAFYLIVICTIDLFHNEGCVLGAIKTDTKNDLSSHEPCLVCMFSASFKSTEVDHGPVLLKIEPPVIFQPLQHLTVVNHHERAYSFLLRAPPSAGTS